MDEKKQGEDRGRYPLSDTKTGKKISRTVVNKTGFDPVDLMEAPAKPPELKNVRRSFSALQFALIMAGSIIAAIGLVIWILLLRGGIGIAVMAVGAVCIVVGTLVRV